MYLVIKKIVAAFLIWLIGGWPTIVFALPSGGQIVSGTGTIVETSATQLDINQNSSQLIATFQNFNTAANETVNVNQNHTSDTFLAKVLGTDPTLFFGKLNAKGQVFITNGSGVFFGPGSQIDVHGLVATTMDISNQDFIDRNYRFTQNLENPLSSVINEGVISATSYVGLLAPAVENRGTIVTASLGSIDLASGTAATMDFTGDGLIQFEVTQAVSGTVLDKDGNELEDRVSNTGLLHADGGQIRMSAKDAGDVIRHVVNMEGMIKANSVVEKNGKVFLMGGDSGVVNVSGTIDASGDDAGEKGGQIVVLGEKVGLFDQAKINASGDAGGGEILIGGEQQGATAIEGQMNADFLYMADDVEINADALTNGDGGRIITWATDTNRAYANIYARGGALSGDGGFVEISGGKYFEIGQVPDVIAVNGTAGHWLIDPVGNDLSIVAGGGNTNINSANPFATTNDVASVGWNLIRAALIAGASVTVTTTASGTMSESGNINVLTDLDYNGIGTGKTLTLTALGDITFSNKIFDSVGTDDILNLNLNSGGAIAFNASGNVINGNLVASTFDGVGGTFTIGSSGDLTVKGTGPSSITAFDFVFDGALNFDGAGTFSINQSSSSAHFGIGTTICQTTSCDTLVDNAELNRINVPSGTLEFNGSSKIFVTDVAAANTDQINRVVLTTGSGNDVEFEAGTGNTFSTNLSILSGNDIIQSSALTVTGTSSFTVSGGNLITLTTAGNDFMGEVSVFAGTGLVQITDTNAFILGASTTTGNLAVVAGGAVTQTGPVATMGLAVTSTGGTVTLENVLNDVDNLSISATGNVNYIDSDGFTVDAVNSVLGVSSSSGSVHLTALAGNIMVSNTAASYDIDAGAGISILLSAAEALFTINSGAIVRNNSSGDIVITADIMDLTGDIMASGQRVTLKSTTADHKIALGFISGAQAMRLELTTAELDNITASYLEIGSTTQGDITVISDISPLYIMRLHLISGKKVTASTGGIIFSHLAIEAGGDVNFTNTNTDVDFLAIDAQGFDATFYDADDLDINTVDGVVGVKAKSFTHNGPGLLTTTSPIVLDTTEEITPEVQENIDQGQQAGFADSFLTNAVGNGC
jgi:filamentous hemagglutinin family protein